MKQVFEQFEKMNVLIIGDIMMDTYFWGSVERISPEAPVPIVSVHKKESRLGGAANVALNLLALGAHPVLCGIVGDDKDGDELKNMVQKKGMDTSSILSVSQRPTTVKTRVIAHNQQIVRIDAETDQAINDKTRDTLIQKIKQNLKEKTIHAIIFQDYDKGALSPPLIQESIYQANAKEILTIVDPKKRNFWAYQHVSIFKPNLKELKDGLKTDINPVDISTLAYAAAELQEHLSCKQVLITLSEHGIFTKSKESQTRIPAHVRNIADVSGAGDTVTATAALCAAAGLDEYKTAAIANLAGGLVCEYAGVVPINKNLLLKEALKLGYAHAELSLK